MSENLEQLLALAHQAGATDAEVYQVRSRSRPVFFEGNRLKQLESSQSAGTALRLWRNGCPGLAVAYGQFQPEKLVDKAIALSKLQPSETVELTPARTDIRPHVGKEMAVETLIEMGKNAIAQIREVYPEVICSAEFECEEETTTLLNSRGLHCEYSETSLSYYLGVELVRGEDFLGIYDGEYSLDRLNPNHIVQQILQRLDWAKNNVTPQTGKVPVLLTANSATLLWGTVLSALNGKRVVEGSSPWSNSKEKMVMSESITLSQQPEQEPYSCPFDDEGTLTQPLSLITEGRLTQFYCDRTVGRELGIGTTGNGFRPGLGTYPTPSLVNVIVEPGEGLSPESNSGACTPRQNSLAELIASLDRGIVVDQILGGGADISGDFSINVDLGYQVSQGQIVGRVKDTMIAGNVYDVLKQVVALGSDRTWNGSCYTPSLIVEGLSVVG